MLCSPRDGLYSKSHEKDTMAKIYLNVWRLIKNLDFIQKMDADGQPKRFQAHGKDCKIMKVITTDSKGQPTTMHRNRYSC